MKPAVICKHNADESTCLNCAFTELSASLQAIETAVTAARGSSVRSTFVTGGTPSWEPVNLAALSLLQDIVHQGGRLVLGRRANVPATRAAEVLWSLERQADRLGPDDELSRRTRHLLDAWRRRADALLQRTRAPWPLPTAVEVVDERGRRRHTTEHTHCPVVDPQLAQHCSGRLMVHPPAELAAQWGDSAAITCTRDRSHTWSQAKGGWLRLSVLLRVPRTVAPS
jgi:hypothetical protein